MALYLKMMYVFRLIFCIVNNFYAVPVYLLLYVILQPLKFFAPRAFWYFEGWLYEKLLSMVAFWAQLSGHQVFISGDDVFSLLNDECIVISNHQSTGDVPVLMHTLRGIQPSSRRSMWIMDWILQFLSFGWIAKAHGDCFILQGSDIRKYSFLLKGTEEEIKTEQAKKFKQHLRDVYCKLDRKWMILFPEGGFLYKRREGSQRFCKRNGLPNLEHVALPRTGAIQAIVDVLGVEDPKLLSHANENVQLLDSVRTKPHKRSKKVKWVIDVTVGYEKAVPIDFLSWVTGHNGPQNIYIHFKVFPASELLQPGAEGDSNKISDQWVYNRFIEKEDFLRNFYSSGVFPGGKLGIKKLKCYTAETIFGHIFCLLPYILIAYLLL